MITWLIALLFVASPAYAQIYAGASVSIPIPPVEGCTSSNVTASISAHRSNGVAPLAVNFDMTGTTNTQGLDNFGEIVYYTDFDDVGAGTWATNGASKEYDIGPIVGHVFETPGTYQVVTTAFLPDGTCDSTQVTITVTDPDDVFPTTQTVCVSKTGGFTGCPAGATQATDGTGDFDVALATTCNVDAASKRCLFESGTSWTASAAVTISNTGPGIVGKYGSGADPTIAATGGVFTLNATTPASDWRFMDFNVTSIGVGNSFVNKSSAGSFQNITILGNVGVGGGLASLGNQFHSGLAYVDNTWSNCDGGTGNNCVFTQSDFLIFLGNTIDDSTAAEHVVRVSRGSRAIVAHNNLSDSASGRSLLKFHAATTPGCTSDKINVYHNSFVTGLVGGQVGFATQTSGTDETLCNLLFDSNFLSTDSGITFDCGRFDATNLWIRNNVCRSSGVLGGFNSQDDAANSSPGNVHVYNNTGYSNGATGTIVDINSAEVDAPRECYNNLLVTASGAPDPATGCTEADTDNFQTNTTVLSTQPPTARAHFNLLGSGGDTASILNQGTAVDGDRYDFEEVLRDSTPDIGADEYGSPTAVFTASKTSCFAPCDVYFDASGTTDSDLTTNWQRFIDLNYEWNFDDSGSGNWTRGASLHSKNVDTGQVAGHVFDSAGTYDVVLTVRDATGKVDSETVSITVSSQDSNWPTTNTICVTTGSDFTGCPSGATQISSQSDFDAALNTDCNVDGAARRCLFRRGDTFTASTFVDPTITAGDILIGAYGSGAKPIVNVTGFGAALFQAPPTAFTGRMVVMDLAFDGDNSASQDFYSIDGGSPKNMFVYRVEVTDFRQFDMYGGSVAYDPDITWPNTGAMPTDISVVEVTYTSGPTASAATGLIMFYSSVDRLLFMGNDFGDMETDEQHVLRFGWWNGVVLSHNDLGRGCGSAQHVLKMHNHKDTETGQCSRRAVIADNLIEACQSNDLDVEISPNSTRGSECTEQVVFERNHLKQDGNSLTSHRSVALSGEGYVARNNLIDLSGASHSSTPRGITVRLKDPSQLAYKPPKYIRLYNNTCYQATGTSGNGECMDLLDGTNVSDVIFKNNLLFDPAGGGTADLFVNSGVANLTLCTGGLESPCNSTVTSTPFNTATPSAYADYQLSASAPANDDGEVVPSSQVNFSGTTHPLAGETDQDIGAWQD